MNLPNVGDVIATRMLHLIGEAAKEIRVLIGKPRPFPAGRDFYCPYQITGLGDEKVRYAGGIDAVQALQLAMRMIACDLGLLNESSGRKLRWEGDESGDLGFPTRD